MDGILVCTLEGQSKHFLFSGNFKSPVRILYSIALPRRKRGLGLVVFVVVNSVHSRPRLCEKRVWKSALQGVGDNGG